VAVTLLVGGLVATAGQLTFVVLAGMFLTISAALESLRGREAQEERATFVRRSLSFEPSLGPPLAIGTSLTESLAAAFPWLRETEPPVGALRYWRDASGRTEVVLWTGSGVVPPSFEHRSDRSRAEVRAVEDEISRVLSLATPSENRNLDGKGR
jgi:hypothetical protein